jgi:AcrR family transcriptional regulator
LVPRQRLTRSEQQARTRAAFVDAAAELVIERGLAGASIERISERAGYTRGAFYSNFSSREELFAELLHRRVFDRYREMAERVIAAGAGDTPEDTGAALARVQADDGWPWLFRLLLEMLSASGRDEGVRELAAGFWRQNAELSARAIAATARARGAELAYPPDVLATASVALDIGLTVQRFVDPERVGLDVWPKAFAALYAGVAKPGGSS